MLSYDYFGPLIKTNRFVNMHCIIESWRVPEPVNNVNIRRRGHIASGGYTYFSMNKDLTITKAGKLSTWKFYSNYNGSVTFQVWRSTKDKNKYVLSLPFSLYLSVCLSLCLSFSLSLSLCMYVCVSVCVCIRKCGRYIS